MIRRQISFRSIIYVSSGSVSVGIGEALNSSGSFFSEYSSSFLQGNFSKCRQNEDNPPGEVSIPHFSQNRVMCSRLVMREYSLKSVVTSPDKFSLISIINTGLVHEKSHIPISMYRICGLIFVRKYTIKFSVSNTMLQNVVDLLTFSPLTCSRVSKA